MTGEAIATNTYSIKWRSGPNSTTWYNLRLNSEFAPPFNVEMYDVNAGKRLTVAGTSDANFGYIISGVEFTTSNCRLTACWIAADAV